MDILKRLRNLEVDVDETPPEPEVSPELAPKVDAILAVMTPYLDPDSGLHQMLYTLARREIMASDEERIDELIRAMCQAADVLGPWVKPAPAPLQVVEDGA